MNRHICEQDLELALESFCLAVECDGANANAWHNRVQTLQRLGRPDEVRRFWLEIEANLRTFWLTLDGMFARRSRRGAHRSGSARTESVPRTCSPTIR